MKYKVQIIFGPTASGKSALALEQAQKQGGVIINADAMQLYRELRVVTARPNEADEARVSHALYGVLPASQAASVGWWVEQAAQHVRAAWNGNKLPIITGGTGMYIKCLLEGIAEIPPIALTVREQYSNRPTAELYAELQQRDPAMAARLKPGDTQRTIRALEVLKETGRSLLHWQEQGRTPPLPEAEFEIVKMDVPRTELYARCDARFLKMLGEGALEEVQALMRQGLPASLPAMRAVGVPEIMAHIRGEIDHETMIEKARQATRNYAKRQLTWMRNQLN